MYKCKNTKKKKTTVKGTSKFRMHLHWNQKATSERRKKKDRTNRQII